MELKDNSKTTFARNKTFLIFIIILGICLLAASLIIIHNHKIGIIKKQYSLSLNECNSEIKAYNDTLDDYDSLVTGLYNWGVVVSESAAEKKEEIIYDFDSFYNDGSYSFEPIAIQINEIRNEKIKLTLDIKQTQVKYYNDLVRSYNDAAGKYNLMLERFSAYPSITVSDNIAEKQRGTLKDSSWNSVDIYFEDYATMKEEITNVQIRYYSLCLSAYNDVIRDYNLVAEAYNEAVKLCVVDFINDLPKEIPLKKESTDIDIKSMSETVLYESIETNYNAIDSAAEKYLTVLQIINPPDSFIKERLTKVSDISEIGAVTEGNDPNGLLGKEGGYTSCTYFTVKYIDTSKVKGNTVVEKGTDAGGAIEVYATAEDALNRCDYLSQFDGTLLYSGSYAVVGTMVIRTSYKLTNKQQSNLTNRITEVFTSLG